MNKVFILLLLFFNLACQHQPKEKLGMLTELEEPEEERLRYGISEKEYKVFENEIAANQFLADIMLKYGVSYPRIQEMVEASSGFVDFRKIKKGDKYSVFCSRDSSSQTCFFVYEPNNLEYVVFDLRDSISVEKRKKEVSTRRKRVSGEINASLYTSLQEQGVSTVLAMKLSEIYAWSIDFYRIQKGDQFTVVFDEILVDGEVIGIGNIESAKFIHRDRKFYAFQYEYEGIADYFDEEGKSLRKAFLQAPLKFGRISSGFTMKRFHPVQKRWKAHLGTDYAAPKGTPIIAVGDGTVIEAKYGQYNGRYVKIKHNGTYTTQYLHMSAFAKGIRAGRFVKQGEVIGYVGSTGLATGPHVCFRFWKNNKQVDHRKEKIPASKPVKQEDLPQYLEHVKEKKKELDKADHMELST